jgi:hypothetical protein
VCTSEQESQFIKKIKIQIKTQYNIVIQSILNKLSSLKQALTNETDKIFFTFTEKNINEAKLPEELDKLLPNAFPLYAYLCNLKESLSDHNRSVEQAIKLSSNNVFITSESVKHSRDYFQKIHDTILKIQIKINQFDYNSFPKSWQDQILNSKILLPELEQGYSALLTQLNEAFKDRSDKYKELVSSLTNKLHDSYVSSRSLLAQAVNVSMGKPAYYQDTIPTDSTIINENSESLLDKINRLNEMMSKDKNNKFSSEEMLLLTKMLSQADGEPTTSEMKEYRLNSLNDNHQKLVRYNDEQKILEDTQYRYILLASNNNYISDLMMVEELKAVGDLSAYLQTYDLFEISLNNCLMFDTIPLSEKENIIRDNCIHLITNLKKRARDLLHKIFTIFNTKLIEVRAMIDNNEIDLQSCVFEDNKYLQKLLDEWDTKALDKIELSELNEFLSIKLEIIRCEELRNGEDFEADKYHINKKIIISIQEKIKNELNKK